VSDKVGARCIHYSCKIDTTRDCDMVDGLMMGDEMPENNPIGKLGLQLPGTASTAGRTERAYTGGSSVSGMVWDDLRRPSLYWIPTSRNPAKRSFWRETRKKKDPLFFAAVTVSCDTRCQSHSIRPLSFFPFFKVIIIHHPSSS